MGLDMYLYAERFIWTEEGKVFHSDKSVHPEKTKKLVEEAAYWRKANHIHAWFVKYVQKSVDEGGTHPASRDAIKKLVSLCKQVLADRDKAPLLLPTQDGFFFGSTEYDEDYFADTQRTIEMLESAMNDYNEEDWDFTYHASW